MEMGISNNTSRLRVMELEKRKELSVARTEHPGVPSRKILAEIKGVWDLLMIFWYWTFVQTWTWPGRVWCVELKWSGRSFNPHTSRQYIRLDWNTHLWTYWRYFYFIIITFHYLSHKSSPGWHARCQIWWLWWCQNGWFWHVWVSILCG